MFVNRSLVPNHHQYDWLDLTNQLLNKRLVPLDDKIIPRIILSGMIEDERESRLLGSGHEYKGNWNDQWKFQVKLDVTHFTPEEITVKVKGNNLLVEGKHEEKLDTQGYVSRQFTRRYTLDDDVDLEQLSSSIDAQGKTLTIHAPKKRFQLDGSERVIPITVREKKQLK